MNELVKYSSEGHIATTTINRPAQMHALNEGVVVGLQAAWRRFEACDDRVAILHATGDRAFSVGADIKEKRTPAFKGR